MFKRKLADQLPPPTEKKLKSDVLKVNCLSDLINPSIINELTNRLNNKKTNITVLSSQQEGCGKTTLAKLSLQNYHTIIIDETTCDAKKLSGLLNTSNTIFSKRPALILEDVHKWLESNKPFPFGKLKMDNTTIPVIITVLQKKPNKSLITFLKKFGEIKMPPFDNLKMVKFLQSRLDVKNCSEFCKYHKYNYLKIIDEINFNLSIQCSPTLIREDSTIEAQIECNSLSMNKLLTSHSKMSLDEKFNYADDPKVIPYINAMLTSGNFPIERFLSIKDALAKYDFKSDEDDVMKQIQLASVLFEIRNWSTKGYQLNTKKSKYETKVDEKDVPVNIMRAHYAGNTKILKIFKDAICKNPSLRKYYNKKVKSL